MYKKLLLLMCLIFMASCASSRRVERFLKEKSLASESRKEANRVNLFPLAYNNADATSIMWPIFESDRHGLAVRPFFNKEDDEWAIMFPLIAWNPVNGDGWAGPAHWTKEHHGVFPFYYQSEDFSQYLLYYQGLEHTGVLPFFDCQANGDIWAWGLYGRENTDTYVNDLLLFGALGNFKNYHNGDYKRYLFPWYSSKHGASETDIAFPFFFSSSDEDEYSSAVLPLWYYQKNLETQDYNFHTLLGGRSQQGDWNEHQITPLWWHGSNGESSYSTLFPLLYSRSDPDESLLLSPFLSYGSEGKGESSFINVLGPLFYHSEDNSKAYTSVMWPLSHFWDDGVEEQAMIPFMYYHNTNASGDFQYSFLSHLGEYYNEGGQSGARFTPFFANVPDDSSVLNNLSMFYREKHGDGQSSYRLWPLMSLNRQKSQKDLGFYTSLFGMTEHDEFSAWNLTPLWRHSSDGESSNTMMLPLFFSSESPGESLFISPFFSYGSDDDEENTFANILGPLYTHTKTGNKEFSSFMWPLVNFFDDGKTRQTLVPFLYYGEEGEANSEHSFLLHMGEYYNTGGESGARLTPFFANVPDDSSVLNNFNFFYREKHADGQSSVRLWPLVSLNRQQSQKDLGFYTSMLGITDHENLQAWNCTPLLGAQTEDGDGHFRALPLYWHNTVDDCVQDRYFLGGLGESGDAGWRMTPFASVSDGSGGFLYDLNLFKAQINEEEVKVNVFPLFHFDADYDDKGNQLKREWQFPYLLPLVRGEKTENGHKVSSFPLFHHVGEGDNYDGNVLGIMADWEKSGKDTRFRFPALFDLKGLVDISSSEEASSFNIFFLYSQEKTPDVVRRDIAGGITWDSGEKESRFSFLWRVFEYHNNDGKKGGHFFFIPFGEDDKKS